MGPALAACSSLYPKQQIPASPQAGEAQVSDSQAVSAPSEAMGEGTSQLMASASATPGSQSESSGEGQASRGRRHKVDAPYRVGGKLYVPAAAAHYDEVGIASWYGGEFNGRSTADGERFNMFTASAAHTTLPLPSIVEVTNLENHRSIRVRINDRGPFKPGRIIDLSRDAAKQLGYLDKGLARVRVRYVGPAGLGDSLEPSPEPALRPLVVARTRTAEPDGLRLVSASRRLRRSAAAHPIWTAEATARLELIMANNSTPNG